MATVHLVNLFCLAFYLVSLDLFIVHLTDGMQVAEFSSVD